MTFLEQMEFTNRENKFMKHCGIQITALEEGRCRAELQVEDYCKNTGETIHGGLLYTMADCVVSAYSRAMGGKCVTLDGTFRYLRNVTEGTVVAEAIPVKLGRTILVFRVQVTAGEKLLGEGSFSCYRKEGNCDL